MVLLLALAIGPASAEPSCPSQPEALVARSEAALDAWMSMDVPHFSQARADSHAELACQSAPMTPGAAAAVHRVEALGAYLSSDEDGASQSFQAAILADPGWVFPEALAPSGNPLHLLYVSARSTPPPAARGEAPRCAALSVDGADKPIPDGIPAVLQLSSLDTSEVLWTHYLTAGEALPDWESLSALSGLDCAPPLSPEQARARQRVTRGLLIGAGAGAVGAGVMMLGARQAGDDFDARDYTTRAEGDALARRANNLFLGAQIAGAAGIALGATSVTLVLVW